jgi:hypothetical protein
MAALKITKRRVDPITFTEFWGGEFIPRIEDFMMDQTIASSMCYGPPRPVFSPPPPPLLSPPTSPIKSPSPIGFGSPLSGRSPRSNKLSLSRILERSEQEEDGNAQQQSLSELSAAQSITDVSLAVEDKPKLRKIGGAGVRFADNNEVNEISRLRDSVIADMFYESGDLATFRYEAFMEDAGLDPSDFE